MNISLMKALHQAVLRCHSEAGVRVVHLRGAGRNFCAGGDVHEFASKGEGLGDFLREVTAWLQMAVGALIRLNAVVVAEVQGFAAGGGGLRSEEHTSELQSLMRISYAVFCLKKKKIT